MKDKIIKILVSHFKKYLQNFKLGKVTFNSIQKALPTEEIMMYFTILRLRTSAHLKTLQLFVKKNTK